MSEQERNTHFQGFADLLFPEVSKLFLTLYARISELRPIEEIDAVEDGIKILLAQRGYDLVYHSREYSQELIREIPDLTAWPEYEEKQS